MNILFITPSFPSRFARIRAFNLIKYLSRRHRIHLLSLSDEAVFGSQEKYLSLTDFKEMQKYCASIDVSYKPLWKSVRDCLLYLISPLPLEISYCKSGDMKKMVKELVHKHSIDLVYIKRLRAAQFVEDEILDKIPTILDTTDSMSMYYERTSKKARLIKKPLFYEEHFKYRLYEKKIAKRFKEWVVCSTVDKKWLLNNIWQGMENPPRVNVIPNGVDVEYYSARDNLNPKSHTVIFSGVMNKVPNIDAAIFFAKKIFPLIREKVPGAKFLIAGPTPIKIVRKLERIEGISVIGMVPDLREYILKSHVVVCPLRSGAGTRNKILQAFSLGRPVVSTALGAEGLNYENEKNIFIADEPEQFARYIMKLLGDNDLCRSMAVNAKEFVFKDYGMENIISDADIIINYIKKRQTVDE